MKKEILENTLRVFRKVVILTILELSTLADCSVVNARRYLRRWGTYTSYNKNGRYYVLPDVPDFDDNGLWRFGDIRFSKYGNLKQTILHLIESSPGGLDASAISELLGFDSSSLLSRLEASSVLRREKYGSRFVYFSMESKVFKKQTEKRQLLPEKPSGILSDAAGVLVLVERIKHPRLGLTRLTERLQKLGLAVELPDVRDFFIRYDLLKKTLDFRRF